MWLAIAAVVIVVGYVVATIVEDRSGYRNVSFSSPASMRVGGGLVWLSLDECVIEHRVHVVHSADAVTVTVSAKDPRDDGVCSAGESVPLDPPLGDRVLVDGSTGLVIEIGDVLADN